MKLLFIEEVKPKEELCNIKYKWIAKYYDAEHGLRIRKIKIDKHLIENKIYALNFINTKVYHDDYTYEYVVLKAEENNIYYISEYVDGLLKIKESVLDNKWIKCSVDDLGIKLDKYNITC